MTDPDLDQQKADLRKAQFAARKAARDACDPAAAAETARDHFLASRLATGCAVISAFRPILTEIDPTPLMLALIDAGHRMCVPVIEGAGKPLRFREWTPETPMEEGAFGAMVPAEGDWLEPELLISPLLAFDAQGWRLGYGGGFYDRTLAGLRAKRKTLAVGFAFAAQQIDAVPIDEYDQRLDAIVTEAGLIRPAAAP